MQVLAEPYKNNAIDINKKIPGEGVILYLKVFKMRDAITREAN